MIILVDLYVTCNIRVRPPIFIKHETYFGALQNHNV